MDTSSNGPAQGPERQIQEPRRRRRWPFVVGGLVALGLVGLAVVAVVLILSAGGPTAPTAYDEEYVAGDGRDIVAVVPVEGTIAPADNTLGGTQPTTTPEGFADALRQAGQDTSVVAVVIEVNSPGGGVTASDEMHQSILDFKKNTGKPVVVSMGDTAASGGYYIATAADRIFANENTLTGSLGVIFSYLNFTEAAEEYGIEQEVVKSGPFKDIGSPTREPTEEELEILQAYVDEGYDQFVQVIVEGRDLPEEEVREIADGRVYSGLQAEALGLVDELGGLDRAAEIAGELASLEEEATVVRYQRRAPGLGELLLSRLAPSEPEALKVLKEAGLDPTPELRYLYRP